MKIKIALSLIACGAIAALVLLPLKDRLPLSQRLTLVPYPETVVRKPGAFRLSAQSRIVCELRAEAEARFLANRLHDATGFEFPVTRDLSPNTAPNTISLTFETNARGGKESYELEVRKDRVNIRARETAGLFYGVQTLLQLLPPQVFSARATPGIDWQIPSVSIHDQPRFQWRGAMLDVSRHFFNPDEIKRFLDLMALHKLNVFHWHLTDDQGWRIEIKHYPRLTQVGAWRKHIGFNLDPHSSTAYGPDGRYGGYYRQEQVRDIVAYAQARHISIVPEIEMPGHCSAALAAYPELSCSGGPYTTDMSEAVKAGVFCAGNEQTFEFLETVLTEVTDLFPSEFVHVGGDEVPTGNWHACPRCQARMKQEGLTRERDLETYFLRRIEAFLATRKKRMIGWSEIANTSLAPSTVVMDWIGGGAEAARAGHDVVMSPENFCYLDFYQSKDRSREPPAAGAYLPLKQVYAFEPVPATAPVSARAHFLGGQGNLWTEYMPSFSQVEYMAFPRLSALSETLWSPVQARDWQDFRTRLLQHEQRLRGLGVHYRPG